jgi:hypothetical protein
MRKFIVCLVLGLSFLPGAVPAQPSRPLAFNPVRSLTTWYTDRTPVDIEVVGGFDSKSVLRIRLERAFVQYLIARETTIVSFGLDKDTGLPASLFSAVSPQGELDRIPGVPVSSGSGTPDAIAEHQDCKQFVGFVTATDERPAADMCRRA